jgi:hypothetical protein
MASAGASVPLRCGLLAARRATPLTEVADVARWDMENVGTLATGPALEIRAPRLITGGRLRFVHYSPFAAVFGHGHRIGPDGILAGCPAVLAGALAALTRCGRLTGAGAPFFLQPVGRPARPVGPLSPAASKRIVARRCLSKASAARGGPVGRAFHGTPKRDGAIPVLTAVLFSYLDLRSVKRSGSLCSFVTLPKRCMI